jgi:hypothetical protein
MREAGSGGFESAARAIWKSPSLGLPLQSGRIKLRTSLSKTF